MFCSRTLSLRDCGPIVSFTFDDFPRTAALVGANILERFGARGTYYLAPDLMNTSNELGDLFVEDDIHSLLQRGHEIGSHTLHHTSCRSVRLSDFAADVQAGIKAVEQFTGCSAANFAYPFGHASLATKKRLQGCLGSARSILPGLNGPDVDLNLLRANRLYGDIDQAHQIKNLIWENTRRKSWLMFATHDVRPIPSEYGCTPALLEFAVSESARSGNRIVTVGQVLSEIGIASATSAAAIPDRSSACA
jgi:peptidoglycan/xylan/chitin deacetylase (PgdA/CDA1 family)